MEVQILWLVTYQSCCCGSVMCRAPEHVHNTHIWFYRFKGRTGEAAVAMSVKPTTQLYTAWYLGNVYSFKYAGQSHKFFKKVSFLVLGVCLNFSLFRSFSCVTLFIMVVCFLDCLACLTFCLWVHFCTLPVRIFLSLPSRLLAYLFEWSVPVIISNSK